MSSCKGVASSCLGHRRVECVEQVVISSGRVLSYPIIAALTAVSLLCLAVYSLGKALLADCCFCKSPKESLTIALESLVGSVQVICLSGIVLPLAHVGNIFFNTLGILVPAIGQSYTYCCIPNFSTP